MGGGIKKRMQQPIRGTQNIRGVEVPAWIFETANTYSVGSTRREVMPFAVAIKCECGETYPEWGSSWMWLKNRAIQAGWKIKKQTVLCPTCTAKL